MSITRRVTTSPDLIPDDRNFGARLEADALVLPQILLPLLVERVIETDDLFYALILTDPRALAAALGWSIDQVRKAKVGLAEMTGRNTIAPPPARSSASGLARPSFGSMPPKQPTDKPPKYTWGPPPSEPLTIRPPPNSSVPPKKNIG